MSSRWSRRIAVSVLSAVGIATLGATLAMAASDGSTISAAIDATELLRSTRSLSEQMVIIAGGGLLLGIGVGVVAAAGITYWLKNRRIERRLQ